VSKKLRNSCNRLVINIISLKEVSAISVLLAAWDESALQFLKMNSTFEMIKQEETIITGLLRICNTFFYNINLNISTNHVLWHL
jgi:hypothetical protein